MISGRTATGLVVCALALSGPGCTGAISQDGDGKSGQGSNAGGNNGPGTKPNGGTGNNGGGSSTPGGGTNGGGSTTLPTATPGPDGVIDSAGPYALRRLTVLEYANTIRDLLGVALSDSDKRGFAADQVLEGGFARGAAVVSSVDSRQFLDVSTKLADGAAANLGKLMPAGCEAPAGAAEQDCAGKFVEQFGLRAFRRPLSSAEQAGFVDLYKKLRGAPASATFAEAMHDVLLAFLQSPEFLYRWELDGAPIKDGNLYKFGPYEIASRLSYFLWSSMPDEALFQAAKSGGLDRPDQIGAQAERLLKDPRAKDAQRDFHLQWLGIYGVDEIEKGEIYKTFSPEVAKAMITETASFIDAVMGEGGDGKLERLLTSSTSFVNGPLATHYGVPGVTGAEWKKVELNPAQRAGILTNGSYLTRHSKEVESFPIARGVHMLRQVLCQEIPEPNIDLPPAPEQKQGTTTRKLYEDFTAAAACQACHVRINGVGFAFEHYDAVGGYRETEEGLKIDASGSIELASGKLTYTDAVDMVKKLAKTPEVRECVAKNWLRFLLRRDERKEEGGSWKALNEAFGSSSYDLRAMLVAMTKTRAFTHRNPSGN